MKRRTLLIVAIFLGMNLIDYANEESPVSRPWSRTRAAGIRVLDFLDRRLEVGLQSTRFSLDTTQSPGTDRTVTGQTFLGNVTTIEEEQDRAPKLFVNVLPVPYVGVQVAWAGVEARTRNVNNGESDGTVEASGPILSLLLQYPNSSRFTPYATIGRTFWDSQFHEDPWWNYGFSSPSSYLAAGSPGMSRNGLGRIVTTEIDDGTVLSAGLGVRLFDGLTADFVYRTASVSVDAAYYRQVGSASELRRTGNFPLDHAAYGVGLKYVF